MKKSLILVCAAVFILVVGTGIVAPLLSPYAETLNATGVQVGLLFSAFYTVRILSGSYIGKLADRKGAKEILRISLMLYPFIGLLYAISWNYPMLLGARILHGLASAMMLPMVMTYIGHITPEGQEAKYMGIYNTVTFLANSVGPLVGGSIAGEFGYKIAFSSLLFLSCIALILVCILPSTHLANTKQVENAAEKTKDHKKISAWKDGRLISISVINIINSILSVFIISFYAIYLSQKGVDIKFIGLLITINNIIVGITQIPIAKLVDKFDKGILILTSGFLTILIIISLSVVTHPVFIILIFILLGFVSSVILSASSALSTLLGKEKGMGEVMGFLGSATSLGAVIGPLILGIIVDNSGVKNIFIFLLSVWVIGMVMFYFFYKLKELKRIKMKSEI